MEVLTAEPISPLVSYPITPNSATLHDSAKNAANGNVERMVGIPVIPKTKRNRGIPFTPESSRKALETLKEKKARAAEIARQVGLAPEKLAQERAEMLAKEITHTCEVLSGNDLEPRERAQLLTALDRLMERERVMRGIPNPGSYRPSKPRTEQSSSDATPL